MIFLAHQVAAIGQRLADAPLGERAGLERFAREIGIGQRIAPHAEKSRRAGPQIICPGVHREFLQPAITRAHHGQVGKRALQFAGHMEMAVDSQQRMLRLLVIALVGFFERPADMRIEIRHAQRHAQQFHAVIAEPANGALHFVHVDGVRVRGIHAESILVRDWIFHGLAHAGSRASRT